MNNYDKNIRNELINLNDNKRIANQVIPDLYNVNLFEYVYPHPFEYKETDKFVIFTASKSGSTIINRLMDDNNLSLHDLGNGGHRGDINRCVLDHVNFINGYDEKIPLISELSEMKKIINGTSEKDLIIIIRNPIKKWMSGVIQDIGEQIEESHLIRGFIRNQYGYTLTSIPDIVDNKSLTYQEKSDILSELVTYFVSGRVLDKGTTQYNHMELFNEIFYMFLNNNSINLSKLKIIDIDSESGDIIELFKSYYPDLKLPRSWRYWTYRDIWKIMFSEFKKMMTKNDKGIYQLVKRELGRDMYYYNLINENYKNNII